MSEKLRPCYVDKRFGLFHRWVDKQDILVKIGVRLPTSALKKYVENFENNGVIPPDCDAEKVINTYALVEFEDGHIEEIPPTTITFVPHDIFRKR